MSVCIVFFLGNKTTTIKKALYIFNVNSIKLSLIIYKYNARYKCCIVVNVGDVHNLSKHENA